MHYNEISQDHQGSIEKYGRGLTSLPIEYVWGSNPATNGKKIYLPHIPKHANDLLLVVHQSHIFHEVGHIEFTDFNRLERRKSSMNTMLHSIWNSVEDSWMEKSMMNRWNGGESILRTSYSYMINNGMIKDGSTPGDVIPMFVFFTCEAIMKKWDELKQQRINFRALAEKQVGTEVIETIETLCLEFTESLSSTKDCLALAQAIYDLLEPSGVQSQVPSKGEAKDYEKALEQAEIDSKKEAQQKAGAQAQSDDEDSESNSNESNKGKKNQKPSNSAGIAKGLRGPSLVPMPYYQKKLPNGSRLAAVLKPILLDEKRKWQGGRKSGRLVGSQLWRVGVDDGRVFRKKRYQSEVLASVGLLVDLSGSMIGDRIEQAVQSTAEIASALQHLKVPTGIFGFGGNSGASLSIAKPIDCSQPGSRVYGLQELVGGSTPLTEGLRDIGGMFRLPTRNKLLFIITDGIPNNTVTASEKIKLLQQQGINCVVINIENHSRWIPPCPSISIDDASSLSSALQQGLKQVLN